jgi:AcrR family transcriptional regulator
MDLRVKKTKSSIINAFLTLRSHKPLEKITVKELSELAMINKATFYLHYKDIYDLSESLEAEVVESVLQSIPHPDQLFTSPADFVQSLMDAYFAQRTLIHTLFSGSRMNRLPVRIEEGVRRIAFTQNPSLRDNVPYNVLLSYSIYGGYYAYMQNPSYDHVRMAEIIANLAEGSQKNCPPE